jgi:hypothetical protein
MLQAGGVENDGRMVSIEDSIDIFEARETADFGVEGEFRKFLRQASLQVKDGCLGLIETDERARGAGGNLRTNLRPDGAGSTGHKDDFTLHLLADGLHIYWNRCSA